MTTQTGTSLFEQVLDGFQSGTLVNGQQSLVSELRERARAEFRQLGFPSTRVEDWKYTNLSQILKEPYTFQASAQGPVDEALLSRASIDTLDCYKLVIVNGSFRPELSDEVREEGVTVKTLSAAAKDEAFQQHFGKIAGIEKNHFVSLNTAAFRDGLFVEIKSKKVLSRPLHIIQIYDSADNLFLQSRQLFILGAFAEGSVIESYLTGETAGAVFVNTVSEISLGENARLQHYYIQNGHQRTGHVQHTEVHQAVSSSYKNYKVSFPGAKLLRNNLNVVLNGQNTESHLYGLYLSGGNQLVDNHTLVDHRFPNCQSNELYKGVLKDESTGVFNGKIFVRKPAQKTNAFQQNNNLMLSRKATIDSKPQLEIFADDVKCSHGSTIGQFNEDALFYLKSRGIGEDRARALLVHAFAFDVTEKIPLPEVQEHVNQLLEEKL